MTRSVVSLLVTVVMVTAAGANPAWSQWQHDYRVAQQPQAASQGARRMLPPVARASSWQPSERHAASHGVAQSHFAPEMEMGQVHEGPIAPPFAGHPAAGHPAPGHHATGHPAARPPLTCMQRAWPNELLDDGGCCDDLGLDGFCGGCTHFLRYDLLLFDVTGPDRAVIGDPASEHLVVANGAPVFFGNSLAADFDDVQVDDGHRIEFGWMYGDGGWQANVMWMEQAQSIGSTGVSMVFDDPQLLASGYSDDDGDGIDDDINGNNVYGRDGVDQAPIDGNIDAAAPTDIGDLVEYQITFDELTVSHQFNMHGAELMNVSRHWGWGPCGGLDFIYGVRYLEAEDILSASGTGGVLDASSWSTEAENRVIGPQLGVRWRVSRGSLMIGAEGRFLAGANFQRSTLQGHLASNANPGGQNAPANLITSGFNEVNEDTTFSPVGEFRLDATLFAYEWLAFRLGYNAIVMGGMSRASGKTQYALPTLTLLDANNDDTIVMSALTLGVEFRH